MLVYINRELQKAKVKLGASKLNFKDIKKKLWSNWM